MSGKSIICDKCGAELPLLSVKVETGNVTINGETLKLEYFVCPGCHGVYKIIIVDEEKYNKLIEDLESAKKKTKLNKGKCDIYTYDNLCRMVERKSVRLAKYVADMNKKYNGTFTITASENKQMEIGYLPLV